MVIILVSIRVDTYSVSIPYIKERVEISSAVYLSQSENREKPYTFSPSGVVGFSFTICSTTSR